MNSVLLALRFILTVHNRGKLFAGNFLKRFGAANITCVSVDKKEGLDLRYASYNPANGDELAQMSAAYVTNCRSYVGE